MITSGPSVTEQRLSQSVKAAAAAQTGFVLADRTSGSRWRPDRAWRASDKIWPLRGGGAGVELQVEVVGARVSAGEMVNVTRPSETAAVG